MESKDFNDFNGIELSQSVFVNSPASCVYQFWRNLNNIPSIMCHVESVTVLDDKLSHWVVKGPLGMKTEWNSELTRDIPGRLLGWKSVGKSAVKSAGRVEFAPSADGTGAEVRVTLKYALPGGRLGFVFSKMLGDDPERQVLDCLRKFKDLMERGESGDSCTLMDAA